MLQFKRIDIIVQVLLIIFSFFFGLFIDSPLFLLGYFVVGGWQVTSFLIHNHYRKEFTPAKDRRQYGRTVTFILSFAIALLILAFLIEEIAVITIFYLFLLLLLTPFVACWYLVICINEKETAQVVDTPASAS
jgi:hypothetical protein